MNHIKSEELISFCEDSIERERAAEIAEHLSVCDVCSERAQRVDEVTMVFDVKPGSLNPGLQLELAVQGQGSVTEPSGLEALLGELAVSSNDEDLRQKFLGWFEQSRNEIAGVITAIFSGAATRLKPLGPDETDGPARVKKYGPVLPLRFEPVTEGLRGSAPTPTGTESVEQVTEVNLVATRGNRSRVGRISVSNAHGSHLVVSLGKYPSEHPPTILLIPLTPGQRVRAMVASGTNRVARFDQLMEGPYSIVIVADTA